VVNEVVNEVFFRRGVTSKVEAPTGPREEEPS